MLLCLTITSSCRHDVFCILLDCREAYNTRRSARATVTKPLWKCTNESANSNAIFTHAVYKMFVLHYACRIWNSPLTWIVSLWPKPRAKPMKFHFPILLNDSLSETIRKTYKVPRMKATVCIEYSITLIAYYKLHIRYLVNLLYLLQLRFFILKYHRVRRIFPEITRCSNDSEEERKGWIKWKFSCNISI